MHGGIESVSGEARRFLFWEPVRGQRKARSLLPREGALAIQGSLEAPLSSVLGLVSDRNPAPITPPGACPATLLLAGRH